jgi:hypothetical protein
VSTTSNREPMPSASWRLIQKTLRQLQDTAKEATVFVVSAQTRSGYQIPRNFKLEEFSGLRSLIVMERGESPGRLAMFWTSEELFRAVRSRIETNLSICLGQAEELYVTQGCQRKSSRFWPKALVAVTVFASIAAIFSNFKNIEDIIVNNLSKPNLKLALVGDQPVNVIDGRKTTIELTCKNLGWSPAGVKVLPVVADNSKVADLFNNSEQGLPTISVGGSASLQIRFIPKAGLNTLTVTGVGTAGIYRDVPIGQLTVPITVWKAIDTPLDASINYDPENSSDVLVVSITARNGDPPRSGIRYQAVLNPSEDVSFVRTQDQPFDSPSPMANGGTAIAIWHEDGDLEPFVPIPYSLTLRAKTPKNAKEWKTIADRIKVYAERIR